MKQIISFVITFIMIVTMTPYTAFGYDSIQLEDPVNSVETSECEGMVQENNENDNSKNITIIAEGTCGDNAYWEIVERETGSVLTISGTGEMESYFSSSPSPWKEYDVTEVVVENGITVIGDRSFCSLSSLTSVTVAESVSIIGSYAFGYNDNLKTVIVDGSLEKIEFNAFDRCSSLETVSVNGNIDVIGDSAFYYCESLKDIDVKGKVKTIGNSAFERCEMLENVDFLEGVEILSSSVFQFCTSLREAVLPETVREIYNSAFYGCSALTSVTIPESVNLIQYDVFTGCPLLVIKGYKYSYAYEYAQGKNIPFETIGNVDLVGVCGSNATWTVTETDTGNLLTISGSGEITDYDGVAPWNTYDITEVVIEEGITRIGDYAFYKCGTLLKINLPNSLLEIGDSAFEECNLLCEVEIPSNVTSIGGSAFYGCASLMSVVIPDSVKRAGGEGYVFDCESVVIKGFRYSYAEKVAKRHNLEFEEIGVIPLTGECGDDIKWTVTERDYGNVLTLNGTGESWNYSYYDAPWKYCKIKYVIVETGITAIGTNFFYGCDTISCIALPDSIKLISDYAFSGCVGLTGIFIPESVTSICSAAFDCVCCDFYLIKNSYAEQSASQYVYNMDQVVVLNDHEHNFDENIEITEANCLSGGEAIKKCECSAIESIKIKPTGHTKVKIESVTATCTTEGLTEGCCCSACGEVFIEQEVIPATGHEEIVIKGYPATDDETGLTDGVKCVTCGEVLVEQKTIPCTATNILNGVINKNIVISKDTQIDTDIYIKKGCTARFDGNVTIDGDLYIFGTLNNYGQLNVTGTINALHYGSVLSAGNYNYGYLNNYGKINCATLNVRDDFLNITIPECEHKWNVGELTKVATCTTAGEYVYRCGICAEKKTEMIPAFGHDLTKHIAKDPTCTTEGNIEYYTCSKCEKIFADAEGKKEITKSDTITVDSEAHMFKEVTVAPTCTEPGQTKLVCIGCGKTVIISETLPTGHTPDGNVIIEPTCENDGLIVTVKCVVCGETIKEQEVIPALGHTSGKKVTKATTKKAGSVVETCETCGKQLSKKTISRIKAPVFKNLKFVYDAKVKKPTITVENYAGSKLKAGTDYSIKFKNQQGKVVTAPKAVGKYTAIVTFKGNYSGIVSKEFTINPKATAINKLTRPGKKQIKVTWQKRTAQVTGYEIQYSTTKDFTKKTTKTLKVKNYKTNTKTIKNLKAKKKYWVKIRTYKTVGKKTYSSAWSAKKVIVTK